MLPQRLLSRVLPHKKLLFVKPITNNFSRFASSKSDKPSKEQDKNENNKITSKKKDELRTFNIKQESSRSAPAPIGQDLGVEKLMKKDNKPYIPKLEHKRLTYEYPGLPNQDDFSKQTSKQPKIVSRWSRYFPKIITVVVVVWGAYTIKVWVYQDDESASSNELLAPNEFHKFRISHKEEIDKDHFLIELLPTTTHWQYSYYMNYENRSIWNGDKIWSVDVKQPQIMVSRSYTPLPLYFMKSEYTHSGERKPLMKVVNNDADDYDKQGVMCLYIKKYDDGEVSRYIASRKIGDTIELRGPKIEYTFPYHPLKALHERPIFRDLPSKIEPEHLLENIQKTNKIPDFDNLNFYAAGTGIAPILQVLLSRNPYRGYVNIHYSAQKPGELGALERFIFFLEKIDRIKLVPHYDSNGKRLSISDITKPEKPNYMSLKRIEERHDELTPEESLKLRMDILNGTKDSKDEESDLPRPTRFSNAIEQAIVTSKETKKDASLSVVCGPDGYVEYVAGMRDDAIGEQGPVTGLLKSKGWDSTNVYKL